MSWIHLCNYTATWRLILLVYCDSDDGDDIDIMYKQYDKTVFPLTKTGPNRMRSCLDVRFASHLTHTDIFSLDFFFRLRLDFILIINVFVH